MAWNRCVIQQRAQIVIEPVIFEYTGTIESFTVPKTGSYILEVWGAQGGNSGSNSYLGGLGGYSIGTVELIAGDVLAVVIGGQGGTRTAQMNDYGNAAGGYNGGGQGCTSGTGYSWTEYGVGGGGGATHIAKYNSAYTTLNDYGSETVASQYVYIIAGGGGGGYWDRDTSSYCHAGGIGGGTSGAGTTPGTQTTGYAFGRGFSGSTGGVDTSKYAGGGGGWYGGGYGGSYWIAGGGSGWIGGVSNGSTTAGQRTGNGMAKISPNW